MSTIVENYVDKAVREELMPSIHDSLGETDPVYPMILRSSANVSPDALGRYYKVIKVWSSGVSGHAKFMGVNGSNIIDSADNFVVFEEPQGFPSLDETTTPKMFTQEITLTEQRGNFYMPLSILRSDQLNAAIGSVASMMIQGHAKLVAQQEATMFYTTNTTTRALITIVDGDGGDIANASGDTTAIVFTIDDDDITGRIHSVCPGQLVDIYNSTGTIHRNNSFQLYVDAVDPIGKTFVLRRVDGGTFQVTTALNGLASGITNSTDADGDVIVLKDSMGQGPNGLNNWIKNSGTLFNISLTKYPQFKSYLPSSIGAALSERTLNKHYAYFYEAYPGLKLDTVITTNGVINGFLDALDGYSTTSQAAVSGRMRYDRNGEALDVMAGWDAVNYRFAGRPVTIYTSTYCDKGSWYAIKTQGGNIKRYVPPDVPGTGTDGRFGNELKFVYPVTQSSIFGHARLSNAGLSDMLEAPYFRQWQILPDEMRSMKLTGITEVIG